MADETPTFPSFLESVAPPVDPSSLAARKASFDEQTDKLAADAFNNLLELRENLWNYFWLGTAGGLSPQQCAAAKGNKCLSFFVANDAITQTLLTIKPGCIAPERRGVHPDYVATPHPDGSVTITEKVTA